MWSPAARTLTPSSRGFSAPPLVKPTASHSQRPFSESQASPEAAFGSPNRMRAASVPRAWGEI